MGGGGGGGVSPAHPLPTKLSESVLRVTFVNNGPEFMHRILIYHFVMLLRI